MTQEEAVRLANEANAEAESMRPALSMNLLGQAIAWMRKVSALILFLVASREAE